MIYLNPSKDIFNISFSSKYPQDINIRIINIIGEELMLENLQYFTGEYSRSINLNRYATGIYFLEIETEKGIINKKLILQ